MNPRTELEKRYPTADFTAYFGFLAQHEVRRDWNTQEHHICPRKQFPQFEHAPENKVVLLLQEHALAHKLLEAACGIKAPSTVWIESQTWTAERRDRHAKAARAAHALPSNKIKHRAAMKAAYARPEVKANLSAAMKTALSTPEARKNRAAANRKVWKTRKPSSKPRKRWSLEARLLQAIALTGNQNARKSA